MKLLEVGLMVLNVIAFIYTVYTIPSRVKKNSEKLDIISKNQGIIEKKIENVK